jgi:transposase InsO family protein
VIDLLSRRVVGWSRKAEMSAQLVTGALPTAIWRRGRPGALLHHSSRGSQYTSVQFQRLMADATLRPPAAGVVPDQGTSGRTPRHAAVKWLV